MKTRKLWVIGIGDMIVSSGTDYLKILKEFKENYAGNPAYWIQLRIV